MEKLNDKLYNLKQDSPYPFHMPGHKRRFRSFPDPYSIDITEIEGFDDLHDQDGVIRELSEDLAGCYGADVCFLSVGGSTDLNLSAVFAAAKPGERILIARNSHKSVYNAALLRNLAVSYVYPQLLSDGICGEVGAEDIREILEKQNAGTDQIRAVVITSPTYEGICSDIGQISEVCHAYQVPLIVDSAHGAHLGLKNVDYDGIKSQYGTAFPKNPIEEGADAVILSLHKTLPAFTSTACLIMNHDSLVRPELIKKYFDRIETSSPSYILMAGIGECVDFLKDEAHESFMEYALRLKAFYDWADERLKNIRINRVYNKAQENQMSIASDRSDPSKIIINADKAGLSGISLKHILRHKYDIELEMASLDYGLAMTSVCDTDEGFERLRQALSEIDDNSSDYQQKIENETDIITGLYDFFPEKKYELSEADLMESRMTALNDSAGKVSADFIMVYPPGIPLVCPGEVMTEGIIDRINRAVKAGLSVNGLTDDQDIRVLTEQAAI